MNIFLKKLFVFKNYPWGLPLIIVFFIDSLGTGLTLPYLVFFLTKSIGLNLSQVGQALSLGTIIGIIAIPLGGIIVDKFGSKSISIFLFLIRGLATGAYLLTKNFWTFIVVYSLVTVGNRAWPVTNQSLIASLVPQDKRTFWFGVTRSARNAGNFLGMVLGSIIIGFDNNYNTLFLLDSISFLIGAAILIAIKIPKNQFLHSSVKIEKVKIKFNIFKDKTLMKFLISVFPVTTMYVVLLVLLPAWIDKLGLNLRWLPGSLLTINSISVFVLQIPLLLFTKKIGEKGRMVLGILFLGLSYLAFGVVALFGKGNFEIIIFLMIIAILIYSVGEQLFYPSSATYLSNISHIERQGVYSSSYQILYAISNSLGPLIFLWILDKDKLLTWVILAALAFIGVVLGSLLLNKDHVYMKEEQ